jgi:putative PIN family toxin of toxin-antitoxin system
MSAVLRVVLDTNVLLSAVLFQQGRLAPLRALWQTQRCVPLLSRVTADELVRVLAYPKFRLSPAEQRELLGDILPWCEVVRMPAKVPRLPRCRDVDDQIFLAVAAVGKAECLVSGDRDLLALKGKVAFRILSPVEFLEGLEEGGG